MPFDDRIRAALESATTSLREHLEAELHAFAQEVVRVSMEERQHAVAAASQAAAAEVRSQAEALVADVRTQAEAQVAQFRAAAHKHAEEMKRAAETQIGELRKALDELRGQAQQQLDAARRTAQGEIEKARAEAEKAHAAAEGARAEKESTHAEIHKAKAETEHARSETAAARAEIEDVRRQAKSEVARAQAEAETVRQCAAAEADAEPSRAARLADAIRNLDEAHGLSAVLERLAQCAGREVGRAAVLLVKGDRLVGWRLAGFAPDGPAARSIDLSLDEAGLAGAVLESGIAASRQADATGGPALPPFAADDAARHAMALPVRVGGEVVAVLYADAPRLDARSSDARWPAILEVLVRHASRVLEAMTVQQAAGLSLPRPTRSIADGDHTRLGGAP